MRRVRRVTRYRFKQNIHLSKWFHAYYPKTPLECTNSYLIGVSKPAPFSDLNPLDFLRTNVGLSMLNNSKTWYKLLSFSLNQNTPTHLAEAPVPMYKVVNNVDTRFFRNRVNLLGRTNLIPGSVFSFKITRQFFKVANFSKLSTNTVMWHSNFLIRFLENCSGRKVYLKFNPFLENSLTFVDKSRCSLWISRVSGFARSLGPRIFLKESLHIIYLALRSKDPSFLASWVRGMLYRMSFWKYKLIFRYLKYVMRYLFHGQFPDLKFRGLKIRLKGKISVAGNARTRSIFYKIGETGQSKVENKVAHDMSLVHTFTGVLGFQI